SLTWHGGASRGIANNRSRLVVQSYAKPVPSFLAVRQVVLMVMCASVVRRACCGAWAQHVLSARGDQGGIRTGGSLSFCNRAGDECPTDKRIRNNGCSHGARC